VAKARGRNLLDDQPHDVDDAICLQEVADGNRKVGMTAVATAMAGLPVSLTPGAGGKDVNTRRPCAIVESGPWGGPAKVVAGTAVPVNAAPVAIASLANAGRYDEGWLQILEPEDWPAVKPAPVAGSPASARYGTKLAAGGLAGRAGRNVIQRMPPAVQRRHSLARERRDWQRCGRMRRACAMPKALSNQVRLMLVCQISEGEKSVAELQDFVRPSQSAISQYLALLREHKLVSTRRDGQSVYYRLVSGETAAVIKTLHDQFCNKKR
jgi:glycine cleavage system H lipoate-binding protein/DNA-binding transcriptional ArsR family regulator